MERCSPYPRGVYWPRGQTCTQVFIPERKWSSSCEQGVVEDQRKNSWTYFFCRKMLNAIATLLDRGNQCSRDCHEGLGSGSSMRRGFGPHSPALPSCGYLFLDSGTGDRCFCKYGPNVMCNLSLRCQCIQTRLNSNVSKVWGKNQLSLKIVPGYQMWQPGLLLTVLPPSPRSFSLLALPFILVVAPCWHHHTGAHARTFLQSWIRVRDVFTEGSFLPVVELWLLLQGSPWKTRNDHRGTSCSPAVIVIPAHNTTARIVGKWR